MKLLQLFSIKFGKLTVSKLFIFPFRLHYEYDGPKWEIWKVGYNRGIYYKNSISYNIFVHQEALILALNTSF